MRLRTSPSVDRISNSSLPPASATSTWPSPISTSAADPSGDPRCPERSARAATGRVDRVANRIHVERQLGEADLIPVDVGIDLRLDLFFEDVDDRESQLDSCQWTDVTRVPVPDRLDRDLDA